MTILNRLKTSCSNLSRTSYSVVASDITVAAISTIFSARSFISLLQRALPGDIDVLVDRRVDKSNFLKDLIVWKVFRRCDGKWSGDIAVKKFTPSALRLFLSFRFPFMMICTIANSSCV